MIETGSLAALSIAAQGAFREAYALCLVLQLAITAIGARRFFSSERYGGFVAAGRLRDAFYRPSIVYGFCALWLLSAMALLMGRYVLIAAAANVIICRFLLIGPRWNSLSRGFGAVGQITAWTGVTIFLLELTRAIDHAGFVRAAVVIVARVDFALIMVVAGIYKLTAGYTRNDGFESALVNPWWCYWSKYLAKLSPRSLVFAWMNHAAYFVEILGGLLMLTPFYEYGALAIAIAFAQLGLTLRLTLLPWMVVATFFLFAAPGKFVDGLLYRAPTSAFHTPDSTPFLWIPLFVTILAYGIAIVVVRLGLYYNFFVQRRLPEALQSAVDFLSNHLVITIWRVFTANVINFYLDILIEAADGSRRPFERIGLRSWRQGLRFAHAGEFVALCTTFTTLKYFADKPELFEERLVRYARSVPADKMERVVFLYVSITKGETFCFNRVTEFVADPRTGTVEERRLDPTFDPRAASPNSPIVRSAAPGSYAPAPR